MTIYVIVAKDPNAADRVQTVHGPDLEKTEIIAVKEVVIKLVNM